MSDPTLPLLPFRNLRFPYGFCVVQFNLLVSRKGFGATNQRKDADLYLSAVCLIAFSFTLGHGGDCQVCAGDGRRRKGRILPAGEQVHQSGGRGSSFRLSLRLVESAVPCGSSKGRGHRVFAPLPVWVDSDCRQHKRKSDRRGMLADHDLLQRFHRSRQTPRCTVSAPAGIHAVPAGDG